MKRPHKLNEDAHLLRFFKYGAGDAVVVLHGQISTHGYMRDVVNLIKDKKTVYSFDLLGFGDSPRPRLAAYSVAQHVKSLHATLIDAKVKTPFIIVGHSMGSQLALAYAAAYPTDVKALVISGLPLFEGPKTAYIQMGAMNPRIEWILKGKRARLLRVLTRIAEPTTMKIAGIIGNSDYPTHVVRESVRHSWVSFKRSMENVVIGYDAFTDIKKITQPIKFIFANEDTINRNAKLKLAPYLSLNHTFIMLTGSHQIPLEHPKIIAEQVLSV